MTMEPEVVSSGEDPPSRLLIGLALVAVTALLLGFGYRLVPANHQLQKRFSATSWSAAKSVDRCLGITVTGSLQASSSIGLGPLTKWSDIRIVGTHIRARSRLLAPGGTCGPDAPAADVDSMELQQAWAGSVGVGYQEDVDGLGQGLIRQVRFTSEGDDFVVSSTGNPVEVPGTWHGSTLCVPGSVLALVAVGSGGTGGGLRLRPCVSR